MSLDVDCKIYLSSLDAPLKAFLKDIPEGEKRALFRNPRITITFNDRCHQISVRNDDPSRLTLPVSLFEGHVLTVFLSEVRSAMPSNAWPVSVVVEIKGMDRNGWWPRPSTIGFGASNHLMGGYDLKSDHSPLVTRSKGFSESVDGLDAIREGMSLIASMLPATNRPVRAWSVVHNLMGTHVHHEDIHARTEAEFTLKQRLFRDGIPALTAIIEAGRMEPLRNTDRSWFIATDLEDLDLSPFGTRQQGQDVADEITAHLRSLRDEPSP